MSLSFLQMECSTYPFPPQVPITLSPTTLRKYETAREVQPRHYNTFPLGPECMAQEGGRLLPQQFLLGQHYAHRGEGRPQPSKDARKYPQHGQKVSIAIEESQVSPKIARTEQVCTIFPLGRWGESDHFRLINLG